MTDLLPIGSSALERAIDAGEAARLAGIDPRVIVDAANAWSCPSALLGHLAYAASIDLWHDDWPELKKRTVIANALDLHRAKGTLAGIRAHLALVDCTVTRAIRPPARGFLRAAMTDDQRAAWLGGLPQLRLYPFVHRATAVGRSFYRAPARRTVPVTFDTAAWTFDALRPSFDSDGRAEIATPAPIGRRVFGSRGVWRASRGAELLGTRAILADRGAEHDVGYAADADGTLRLLIGRTARRGWYGRGYTGAGFATASQAASGVVTLRLGDDVGRFAVQAGLDPVDVRPARVAQPRTAPRARAFGGRHRAGTFLRASWAPNLIYDAVALSAPGRFGDRRQTRSFHGRGRFGIRPFTAELRVAVPMRRPRARTGAWAGSGFRTAANLAPLSRALEAIRVSKALRDTVLVDTTTHRGARFGDGLRFGSFAFGEIRKVA